MPPSRSHAGEAPRIGVSACLLGSEVRWDGGHKRDPFLVETLGPFVEWVPVCLEVELGMGVPRETLRLEAAEGGRLARYAKRHRPHARQERLRGGATPRKHTNVLQHVLGAFRRTLDADARAELAALIEDYRRGGVPLLVPLTLIRHHVRRIGVPYLEGQSYLEPHPKELMLRNHV